MWPRDEPLTDHFCHLNRSMQHHLISILFLKGSVHDAREAMEAFCRSAGRGVEPLEDGTVAERHWTRDANENSVTPRLGCFQEKGGLPFSPFLHRLIFALGPFA